MPRLRIRPIMRPWWTLFGVAQWLAPVDRHLHSIELHHHRGGWRPPRRPVWILRTLACPMSDIGQPCEAGTCTQATCLVVDDAGSSRRQTCGVCLSPPPDCTSTNVGAACGEGGVCTIGTVRALGPAGTPPPSQLYYSVSECLVPVSAGDGQDVDAAALGFPSAGDGSTASASPPGSGLGSMPKSGASSGCGVAGTGAPCGLALSVVTGAVLAAVMRKKRAEQARRRFNAARWAAGWGGR